jgi:hypothetical protein
MHLKELKDSGFNFNLNVPELLITLVSQNLSKNCNVIILV